MRGKAKSSEPRERTRKQTWYRRLFRHGVRLIVGVLLVIFALLAFVSFTPLSGARLDQIVKSRWLDSTGVKIDYATADVTLATGMIRLTSPRLIDPENDESLIDISSCEVDIDVRSVLSVLISRGDHIKINRIHVYGPLDIRFIEQQGKLDLSPRLRRLQKLISEKMSGRTSSSEIGVELGSIMLTHADFHLDSVRSDQISRLGAIRQTSLLTEFQRGRSLPSQINIVGKLMGDGGSTGLSIHLSPNGEEEELGLKLRLNPVDSRTDLLAKLPMDFQVGELTAGGLLRRQGPGDWILQAESSTPTVTLVGAGVHGVDHHFQDALIRTGIRWKNETKRLELLDLEFDSSDCNLHARGEVQLADPYQYELNVDTLELRGQAVALTERTFFGQNRIATPDRGRLTAEGTIRGRADQIKPETVDGEFSIEDLSVNVPNLPEPLQSVMLKARITPDSLEIIEGKALVQGLPLFAKGGLKGRPVEGEIESARFEWQVSGEMDGLNGLINDQVTDVDWKVGFSGGVAGSGTIEVKDVHLEHWGEILDKASIEGRLVFNDAEFRSNRLNPPIRRVQGMLEFDRNRARLTDVAGTIEDLAFELTGSLEGQDVFWKEAQLDAEVDAQFDLDDLPRIFAWVDRTPPDLYKARGQLHLTGRLKTPLDQLERGTLSGTFRGSEIFINPPGPHFGETVYFSSIEAEMDAQKLVLSPSRGKWGDMNIELTGNVSPSGGSANLRLEGELEKVPALIPKIGSRFDHLGGSVSAESVWTLGRVAGAPELANFVEVWREIGPRKAPTPPDETDRGSLSEKWALDMDGSVRIDGASLLYENMPVSSHLTEIYGTLLFNLDRCWSEEPVFLVPGVHAETAQTTVLISYPRDAGKVLSLDFDFEGSTVNLDDWLTDWREKTPRVRLEDPENPKTPLDFSLEVDVLSDQVNYRGLEGSELSGKVRLHVPGRNQSKLVWENAVAKFKDGDVRVQGRVERNGPEKIISHDIKANNIEVADLTRAYLDNEGIISSGVVSGVLALEKAGKDAPGYDGEGEFRVEGSRFVSNAIFRGVGRLLKLDSLFNDISFTRIEGKFEVEDNVVFVSKNSPIIFENPSALHPLSLNASGNVGAGSQTDLQLSLQFFPIMGAIPIIGEVWNALTGRIIRLNVRGELDDPKVSLGAPVV